MLDIEPWPICEVRGCDEEVDPRRVAALGGHVRCMQHPLVTNPVFVIDVPKSNPLVTTNLGYAKGIGASHKGNRQVF